MLTESSAGRLDEKKMSSDLIGVVIPALNEAHAIGNTVSKLRDILRNYNYEIVVVDGRSTDGTAEIAKQNGARVISQRKRGYGNALVAGYLHCVEVLQCSILITLDADGTYDPQECPKLLDKIISGETDYVIGRRKRDSKSMSITHKFGNRLISLLVRKLLHVNVRDTQSGFFAFRSELIENAELGVSGWAINTEMMKLASELDLDVSEVDISYAERVGESKLGTWKAGLTNIQVIVRMMRDCEPLLLFGIVGAAFFLLGAAFGIAVLAEWLSTGTFDHMGTVILASLMIITGTQLISLGLVADMNKRKARRRLRLKHNYYKEF